jgi:hypothetical protein
VGNNNRNPRRARALVGVAIVASSLVMASAAGARVFSRHIDATCTAQTPFGPLQQARDFDLDVIAPLETPDTSPFTVTIPGGSTLLQRAQASQQVSSYSNIYTVYQVVGGTIVPGSPVINGDTTWNTGSGPEVVANEATEQSSTLLRTRVPGPLNTNGNNGTLTTPDITFQIQPDALDTPVFVNANEAGSDVTLSFGNVSATCPLNNAQISKTFIGPATATAFSAFDTTVAEPASGTVKVPVTISIVGPAPTKTVKVKYATVDGSAVSSPGGFKDYSKKKGTLSFRRGVTSRTIEVRVVADDFDGEGTQFFTVQLSNPTPGVQLRLDNARVEITD